MPLQKAMGLCIAALISASVAAAVALVVLTSRLHRSAAEIGTAMQNVQLAEECLVDLRALEALGARAAVEPGSAAELARAIAAREASLRARIEVMSSARLQPDAAAAFRAARSAIDRYLDQRSQPMHDRIWDPVEGARATLRAFIELHVADARDERAHAARVDTAADVFGFATAALLVAGTLTVLAVLRRQLFDPMLAISTAISRYARGGHDARVPERGAPELRDIARSFNEMADALERRREDQLAFLAGVAHDIRTPLAAMRLATRTLSLDGDHARSASRLGVLARQLDQLDRLATDFLEAARIEAGQVELTLADCDLRQVAADALSAFDAASDRHPIEAGPSPDPLPVRCDVARIGQVFGNLITNAMKYSPDGGRIVVVTRREGDDAILSVSDHGVGIPPEELTQIFEPFRRGSRLKHAVPGLGLGLATSRRIVERHGGSLEVSSVPGAGSTFTIALPLTTPDRKTASAVQASL